MGTKCSFVPSKWKFVPKKLLIKYLFVTMKYSIAATKILTGAHNILTWGHKLLIWRKNLPTCLFLECHVRSQKAKFCRQKFICGHKMLVCVHKMLICLHKMFICVHHMLNNSNLWQQNQIVLKNSTFSAHKKMYGQVVDMREQFVVVGFF